MNLCGVWMLSVKLWLLGFFCCFCVFMVGG